ncbi:MAG: nucleotidyltransferase family protein, partial [Synergistota bacterium]|nr:nucleotidyltransferase family protein [Synergistota bacterium]
MTKATLAGVIAEYNPFHNGHLYHMRKAKEITGSSAVAVVLSSHFVQRGEPSFIDKWTRAEMALAGGADLVLELPAVFACHNAGVFASAAVDILCATGIVTHIVFGMENPQAPLAEAADTLNREDTAMKERLKESLSRGFSYVEARSRAVGAAKPHLAELLRQPNNSLAVAYVQRIRSMGYHVEPVPVGRLGEGYHSEKPEAMASATMIRKSFRSGDNAAALGAMPVFASDLVKREIERGRCIVSLDTYWRIARSFIALNRR